MDIQQILERLPHRYPFVLIDRVIDLEPGKSIVGIKNVTINEPFFTGHFPNRPIMPGVLILEALAQTFGILAHETAKPASGKEYLVYFAGIDNARFKKIVTPGDQLKLSVELVKCKKEIWKCNGVATVDGEVACSADLITARKEKTE